MGITVLSLFDGMACGRIALKELGIKVDKYYASEIDKHAIKQTMLNFPDTIQLGSVTEVDARKLGHIDLLIGGSPCTNFSFAGRRNGMNTTSNEEIYTLDRYLELKKQGYEFDGESFLFWEYMRILGEVRETNPNSETRRGRKMDEKSNCLMAKENTDFMRYEGPRIINLFGKKVRVLGIRRLTPTECSRLQTIPTWYKWECSDSQAYRMLGNGWTVEVIKHFFQFLPFEREA